jgi:hypothetical protein
LGNAAAFSAGSAEQNDRRSLGMRLRRLTPLFAVPLLFSLAGGACGPRYVTGTQVEYSDEREAIAAVVERYRVAMEQRDADTIRKLASKSYYENGSTTDDPNDDYDAAGLEKVLGELKANVRTVRYAIEITAIEVADNLASVDYDYKAEFMYTAGEQDRWGTTNDKNRMTLRLEDGHWRISSGM